jgi:hypothetical protein
MSEIISVKDNERRLKTIERSAAKNFTASGQAFNRAMEALWEIREEGLWEYARDEDNVLLRDYNSPRFEYYIRLFCTRYSVSRSGTFDHLKTIAVWVKALNRPVEQLFETVGVKEAKPIRQIIDYDGRRGMVMHPPPGVVEQLPPGETDIDRVNAKVDEVFIQPEIPLTKTDVRKSFTIDVGIKEETAFVENENGSISFYFESGDNKWSGIIIQGELFKNLPDDVRRCLRRKLRIAAYDG